MLTAGDIQQLRQTLEEQGCFKSRIWRIMAKLVMLLLAVLLSYAIALAIPVYFGVLLLIPLSIPLAIVVMIGHEAGHQAIFSSRWVNTALFLIIFSLIGGVSITYWSHKHNKRHHNAPNVLGQDDDIELWPIAFYREKIEGSSSPTRFFQKHCQHWLFWGLCFLLGFSMRWDSVAYLIRQRRTLPKRVVIDILFLLAHYLLWILVPLLFVGAATSIIFYLVLWALVGWLLAIIFIVGHTGRPIHRHSSNRWMTALMGSQNIKLPKWLSWCFVGLDYQIEHHLFPKLDHSHMRQASRYVRVWAHKRQLPYHEVTLFRALYHVYITLKNPAPSRK